MCRIYAACSVSQTPNNLNRRKELKSVFEQTKECSAILLDTGIFYFDNVIEQVLDSDIDVVYFDTTRIEIENKKGIESAQMQNYNRIKTKPGTICVDFSCPFKSDVLDSDFVDYLGIVSRGIQGNLIAITAEKKLFNRCVIRREEAKIDNETLTIQYQKSAQNMLVLYYDQINDNFIVSKYVGD